jgi:hypothetical protein
LLSTLAEAAFDDIFSGISSLTFPSHMLRHRSASLRSGVSPVKMLVFLI